MTEQDEIIQVHDSDSDDSIEECFSKKEESWNISSSSNQSSIDSDSEIELINDSESELEIECDLWDDDCKIITITSEKVLSGFSITESSLDAPEPIVKQQKLCLKINENLTKESFMEDFRMNWKSDNDFTSKDFELTLNPFKFCTAQNFVSNESILDNIRQEFDDLSWNKLNLDLFEFFRSKDLKNIDSTYLSIMYEFLNTDVLQWISQLTNVKLTKMSATCSFYSDCDYLLVHDDLREDRMFAFVLYLTGSEGWNPDWGGALQLFSTNEAGDPKEYVKDIIPANNQFIFFPVTNKSFHQVAEVLNKDFCRLSINGWFHVEVPPTFDTPLCKEISSGLYSKEFMLPVNLNFELEAWIKPDYLKQITITFVQHFIQENSEISLKNFFKIDKISEIVNNLKSETLIWQPVGPKVKRSYDTLVEEGLPSLVEEFINLFKSKVMFSLLYRYTDLDLSTSKASMRYELQRWKPGSYTLLTDNDEWEKKEELDVIFYFGCPPLKIVGGCTEYVSLDEEVQQALIAIEPTENTLNLVYRDTARFTRYVSQHSSVPFFYILVCSYSE